MANQEQINNILFDLIDRQYWDVRYRPGSNGKIGYVTTRQEYDIETCHQIIDLLIRCLKNGG